MNLQVYLLKSLILSGIPEHPNFTKDQQVIFSSEVILKRLKDLNINKSPGPDSINVAEKKSYIF